MSAGELLVQLERRRERAKDTLWNKERRGGIPQRQGKGGEERETQNEFGVGVQDADHVGLCGAAAAVPAGPVHRK